MIAVVTATTIKPIGLEAIAKFIAFCAAVIPTVAVRHAWIPFTTAVIPFAILEPTKYAANKEPTVSIAVLCCAILPKAVDRDVTDPLAFLPLPVIKLKAPATPLIMATAVSQTPPTKLFPMLKSAIRLSFASLKKATILGALLAMLLLRLSTNLLRPSIKPLSLSVPFPRLNTLEKESMIVPSPLETCSPSSLNLPSVLGSATQLPICCKNGFFILSIGSRKAATTAGIRDWIVLSRPPIVVEKLTVASLYLSCNSNKAFCAISAVILPSLCNLAYCSWVMLAMPSSCPATSLSWFFISGKTLIIDIMSCPWTLPLAIIWAHWVAKFSTAASVWPKASCNVKMACVCCLVNSVLWVTA